MNPDPDFNKGHLLLPAFKRKVTLAASIEKRSPLEASIEKRSPLAASSVSDPYHFPDPDPGCEKNSLRIRIRIQGEL